MRYLYIIWTLSFAHAFIDQMDCPSGWAPFGDSCYYASNDTHLWADAKKSCEQNGGFLAEIKDGEENTFVLDLLKEHSGGIYALLGGNDMSDEGKWMWANSNTDFEFENWSPGEPNNLHEDCLVIWKDVGEWNDVNCDNIPARYVCEKTIKT